MLVFRRYLEKHLGHDLTYMIMPLVVGEQFLRFFRNGVGHLQNSIQRDEFTYDIPLGPSHFRIEQIVVSGKGIRKVTLRVGRCVKPYYFLGAGLVSIDTPHIPLFLAYACNASVHVCADEVDFVYTGHSIKWRLWKPIIIEDVHLWFIGCGRLLTGKKVYYKNMLIKDGFANGTEKGKNTIY